MGIAPSVLRWTSLTGAIACTGAAVVRHLLGLETAGVSTVLSGIGGLLLGLAWKSPGETVRDRGAREASERGEPDVLSSALGFRDLSEAGGVQWTARFFPERMFVPGYGVLGILLQNAFTTPRVVTPRLTRGPVMPEKLEPI